MIGKKVVIYYNDLPDHVARAEGIVISVDEFFFNLDCKEFEKGMQSIPKNKVVRLEERD